MKIDVTGDLLFFEGGGGGICYMSFQLYICYIHIHRGIILIPI
jgi:hypothetical protein